MKSGFVTIIGLFFFYNMALGAEGTEAAAPAETAAVEAPTTPAPEAAKPVETPKAAETPTIETVSTPSSERYGKQGSLIPGFVFGPKVTLLGAPVPFRIGAEAMWQNFLGIGFDWGFLPALSFNNVSVKLNGWNTAARFYPWQGAFFIGVAFGKQAFTGSQTVEVLVGPVVIPETVTLFFDSTYFAPQLGWRWVWESGAFFGVELGVQIPVSTSTRVSNPSVITAETSAAQAEIQNKANTYGKNLFPHFGLIQLGYYF